MRHNGRPILVASELTPNLLMLYPAERPVLACPDCGTWRVPRRGMLPAHRAGDGVRRCPGSGQRVRIDLTPAQWLADLQAAARVARPAAALHACTGHRSRCPRRRFSASPLRGKSPRISDLAPAEPDAQAGALLCHAPHSLLEDHDGQPTRGPLPNSAPIARTAGRGKRTCAAARHDGPPAFTRPVRQAQVVRRWVTTGPDSTSWASTSGRCRTIRSSSCRLMR